MRTAAAYISKLKAENLARTFKVQDTNHRLFTSTLYRGAAGCGPVDFTQLNYVEPCLCDYIGLSPGAPKEPKAPPTGYDGGTPSSSGPDFLSGGFPVGSGSTIIDGGNP
jgi:hypothetical protein